MGGVPREPSPRLRSHNRRPRRPGTRHASQRAPGGCWSHFPRGLSVGPVCVRGPFLLRERRDRLFTEPQTAHSALNLCHGAATALEMVLGRCSWPTAAGPQSQRQVRTLRPRLWLTRGPWGPRGLLRPRSHFPEADSRVGRCWAWVGGFPGRRGNKISGAPLASRGPALGAGSGVGCRLPVPRPTRLLQGRFNRVLPFQLSGLGQVK